MSGEQKQKTSSKKTSSVSPVRLPTAHCSPLTAYVELHARSAFSFLEGASVPEELIAAAQALEMPAIALLDRDGFYGSPRFHLAAQKNDIKAHIGAEITVVQSPKSKVQSHHLVQSPRRTVQGQTSNSKFQLPDSKADIGHWTLDFGQKPK